MNGDRYFPKERSSTYSEVVAALGVPMVGRRMYLQRISRCMYMYAYPPWTKIPKYEEQNRDHDSGYSGKDESHVH